MGPDDLLEIPTAHRAKGLCWVVKASHTSMDNRVPPFTQSVHAQPFPETRSHCAEQILRRVSNVLLEE